MRKIFILLICCIPWTLSAKQSLLDSLGIDVSVGKASSIQYWMDDSSDRQILSVINGTQQLDVSALPDGIHVIHCQTSSTGKGLSDIRSACFYKCSNVASGSLRYWFDEDATVKTIAMGTQYFDVSELPDGLHTLFCQVVSASGEPGIIRYTMFLKLETSDGMGMKNMRYWFDAETSYREVNTPITKVDVSSLSVGLHILHVQVVNSDGSPGYLRHQMFYQAYDDIYEQEGNAITAYRYWINGKTDDTRYHKFDEPASPMQIVTMLPVPTLPIRTSCFQFAFEDSKPVVYAKNELFMRFYDCQGYSNDTMVFYVDENVKAEVVPDSITRNYSNTVAVPKKDAIQWFKFHVSEGDSVAFRSTELCTIQLFSPIGEELSNVSGFNSQNLKGAHIPQDGAYYLAVHDVTSKSGGTLNLYYEHVDKYAVLRQDVHKVGNGGFSSITFEGNGFDSLLSVSLVNAQLDTIHAAYIGHESNATTPIAFDFTDVSLGQYNALFTFTEGVQIRVENCVEVEEAIDIVLTSTVDYPSSFMWNSEVTYELTITNHGNMTAYNVPIYTYIGTTSEKAISYIKYNGINLPSLLDEIDKNTISADDYKYFVEWAKSIGDKHHFYQLKDIDEDTGDSICIYINYHLVTIAPYETRNIKLELISAEPVEVWFTIPELISPVLAEEQYNKKSSYVRFYPKSAKETYCCWKDRITCYLDAAGLILDVASLVGPEVSVASCVVGILGQMHQKISQTICSDEDGVNDKNFWDGIKAAMNVRSILSIATSCAKKFMPFEKAEKIRQVASKVLAAINVSGNGIILTDCIVSHSNKKPNCPPGKHIGGKSNPVRPSDPNEIRGYMSEAGSIYMRQEVETIHYEIEFENDATVATAPAHTIIIRDTLDGNRFDLATFAATGVTIGNKSLHLDGETSFVRTMDMRNGINAIAQIQLEYNKTTGIAVWTITSLDPMTLEPINDADIGVLPVNYDGRGVGTVSYKIRLKDKFVDGTQISNRASIIFDSNAPIMTPTWTNIVDAVKPTSVITGASVQADSIDFVLETTDTRSHVWRRTFYAREDANAEWETAGVVYEDFGRVPIKNNWKEYYVLATDSAGNVENKAPKAEYNLVGGLVPTYLVTFFDEDGMTVLDQRKWTQGTIPTCEEPKKEADQWYAYTFNHWLPSVVAVTKDADYVAVYTAIPQEPADIQNTQANTLPHKLLRDGQILILRGDHIYTLTGQKVR